MIYIYIIYMYVCMYIYVYIYIYIYIYSDSVRVCSVAEVSGGIQGRMRHMRVKRQEEARMRECS
jgi:hypothetical protein